MHMWSVCDEVFKYLSKWGVNTCQFYAAFIFVIVGYRPPSHPNVRISSLMMDEYVQLLDP